MRLCEILNLSLIDHEPVKLFIKTSFLLSLIFKYIIVVLTFECPINICNVFTSPPISTKMVPKVSRAT